MDPNNDFLNRSSLPYTPHGSLQHMYGPYELRSASASQIQQHRFSNPPYEFVTRAQQTAVQHGNNVSDEWSSVVDLPQPDVSQLTASSNFDPEQLQRFLRSENEGPWIAYGQQYGPSQQQLSQDWHPRLSVPKAHTIAGHPVTLPTQRPASGGRPSQTDYSADSGFESQVTCSNGQDDIPESLSPCRRRDGVESQHGPANSPLRKRPGSVKSESHAERRSRRKKTTVVPPCHVCGKELKNRSDASKHSLQHTKPYHCKEHGCARPDGFATQNDLERHKKSVHHLDPSVGKKMGYICRACPEPGLSKPKWWPRLDNFKAHISRKHQEWDMPNLINMSICARPNDFNSESGYGSYVDRSQVGDEQAYQRDMSSSMGPPMSRHTSHQGDFAAFSGGYENLDPLAGIGEGPTAGHFASGSYSESGFHWHGSGGSGDGLLVLNDAAQQLASPGSSIASPSVPRHFGSNMLVGRCELDAAYPAWDQKQLHVPPAKRQRTDGNIDTGPHANARSSDGGHVCDECGKVKPRECDLRKHKKRHTRPYGCTFSGCSNRHGSRNDWKRHESSQHSLQDSWRCELQREDGTMCRKLVQDEDIFIRHIHERHGVLPNSQQCKNICKQMHLGREAHYHFWCGFCNRLIEQKVDNIQQSPWDMRFKHIGDHFDKDEFHIGDWVDIIANKQKKYIPDDSEKRSTVGSRGGNCDNASDLGANGIPDIGPVYQAVASQEHPAEYDADLSTMAPTYTWSQSRGDEDDEDADGVSDYSS